MQGSLKRLVSRIANGQKGFTLIEMIVVVGIIAVLAAVIVPNMGKFIGQGETGAMNAEEDAVKTAMKAMMADNTITAVTAQANPSTANNDWTALPAGTGAATLDGYLQAATTTYYYCWDASGNVTAQEKTAVACP